MQVPTFQEIWNSQLLEQAPDTDQAIWAQTEHDRTLRAAHRERRQWVASSMVLWHLRKQAYHVAPYWMTIRAFVTPGDNDIIGMENRQVQGRGRYFTRSALVAERKKVYCLRIEERSVIHHFLVWLPRGALIFIQGQ